MKLRWYQMLEIGVLKPHIYYDPYIGEWYCILWKPSKTIHEYRRLEALGSGSTIGESWIAYCKDCERGGCYVLV